MDEEEEEDREDREEDKDDEKEEDGETCDEVMYSSEDAFRFRDWAWSNVIAVSEDGDDRTLSQSDGVCRRDTEGGAVGKDGEFTGRVSEYSGTCLILSNAPKPGPCLALLAGGSCAGQLGFDCPS